MNCDVLSTHRWVKRLLRVGVHNEGPMSTAELGGYLGRDTTKAGLI